MTSKFAESRNLNQMLAVGLSDEARKAVNARLMRYRPGVRRLSTPAIKTSSGSSTS